MNERVNPEDSLWGIWEGRWFEQSVRRFGLAETRKYLQTKIDKRDRLKKANPEAYKRRYCGMGW